MRGDALPFFLVVVLSFDPPSAFFALEVEGAAFAGAGGDGGVGFGEEAFGFFVGVA